ncbi:DNA polymerase III subunit delta' [Caldanaerobacter sp.]|uniref:DNA polymerase III subunit delta' n=1 Tax=Caldanaerobacter sp. TaxID=2930036 RepID=UPI003C7690DF
MVKVYGHEDVLKVFNNIVSKGKISNAYLFVGEEGLGKRFLAEYFAMMVNCKSDKKPCFACSSCLKMMKKSHPDVFVIEPEGDAIKVDTIRYINGEINIKPYESFKKIFIIDRADKMTTAAQNAFLKTLEEPPSYGLFILISPRAELLLPTVVSRCNIIRFKKEREEVIKEYLVDEKGVKEEEAAILAHLADGNFGEANRLVEEEYKKLRSNTLSELERIFQKKGFEVLDEYEFFEQNKEHIEEILRIFISLLRDVLVYKTTEDLRFIRNVDFSNFIKKLSEELTFERLSNIINKIEQLNLQLDSNINYQLAVENLLLDILGGQ